MLSESAALSDLIGDIYDAALDPSRWRGVLGKTCEFVGGSSAVLYWHDAASERSAALHLFNEDPYYTKLYFDKYVKLNPMFPAATFVESGVVHSAFDLIPQEEIVKTRFYREWMKPQGMMDALGAVLEKGIARAALLNIRWVESDAALDEESRRRLALLVPHFQRAVAIGRLFDQNKATRESLTETLDHVEAGVFLVDPDGRVVLANLQGRKMLEDGTLMQVRRDMLTAVCQDANRMLREVIAAAANGDGSLGIRGVALPLSVSHSQWFAHVLPLTSGLRRQAGSAHGAVAAVFVRRSSPEDPSSLEALARRYDLTAGELRVVDAVMKVNGMKAIAELLGVSQETVKSHLHSIYRKTGTQRQNALVKLVAGVGATS